MEIDFKELIEKIEKASVETLECPKCGKKKIEMVLNPRSLRCMNCGYSERED